MAGKGVYPPRTLSLRVVIASILFVFIVGNLTDLYDIETDLRDLRFQRIAPHFLSLRLL